MPHILIQGAGIAGAALAFWLRRFGYETTIIERSSALRSGGQAVDVRGTALEVVERMGLSDDIKARRTRFQGMSVFDQNGNEIERTTERTLGSRYDDGDVEIFHDDLSDVLHSHIGVGSAYIFADEIVGFKEGKNEVNVTLRSGLQLWADVVVGADGVNSGLRRLAFGADAQFLRHLGFYGGIYSIPNMLHLENWQLVVRTTDRGVILYPTRNNAELRVGLYYASDEPNPASDRLEKQRDLFKQHCGDIGGPFAAAVAAIDGAEDLYASPIAQVRMERWSAGRIVLVGDAAFCPSPLTGQGTSLALVGAFVLAQELAREGDLAARLARYEHRLRGFVTANQDIDPATGAGIDIAKNAMDLEAQIELH